LTEYEGIYDTFRAVALLRSRGQCYKLLIAGKGNYEKKLKFLSKKLKISNHIRFLGHISGAQFGQLYRPVDLIVLARKDLPVTLIAPPIKLVEAMAHEKATIVPN
jgi:glycosyltransferase involved in cell wall biosynthesis